jgi:hypothetical protein
MSKEEKLCEAHFQRHTTRDEEVRFVVRLPVLSDAPTLGESRQQAVQRMKNLERSFSKQPELKNEYVKFIDEYAALGHMEEVYEDSGSSMGFYLPRHCVVKESSSTTKIRAVFDGSASSSSRVSLNQVLMVGPTVQPDLCSIILSLRTHVIALSGDIAKMYRQVSVHPDDRDLQMIFWRSSPGEPLKDYRLTTMTYGTSPA